MRLLNWVVRGRRGVELVGDELSSWEENWDLGGKGREVGRESKGRPVDMITRINRETG